jgi:DNA modification methylase
VLRQHVGDATVDLIYLDPPFNSNADYNVLFDEQDGTRSAAQIKAFGDTWQWDQAAAAAYAEVVERGGKPSQVMQAFRTFLGENNLLAYLAMMAPRLMELHRVLKPTGSLYLHCDPTASHYLKLLMDAVFGAANFRNEIVWHYYNKFQRGDINMFAGGHDIIFFYTKEPGDDHTFQSIHEKRDKPIMQLVRKWHGPTKTIRNVKGKDGKVMYREVTERKIDDVWRLPYIVPASKEGLGYPTQKPESLLERIISASTNPGDLVLDPFCGCGTTISVAQNLGRRWIGIDITHLAITLIKSRLEAAYGTAAKYRVIGEPTTIEDAEVLAESDKYQFQWWALGLVGARPVEQKKGADKGIDGRLYFHDGGKDTRQIILSVKGGNLKATDVRDLRGVLDREKADIGVLLSFETPTKPMRAEAATAGFYESEWTKKKYPRLQLLTVGELLSGKSIARPEVTGSNQTYKQAPKAVPRVAEPKDLWHKETDDD